MVSKLEVAESIVCFLQKIKYFCLNRNLISNMHSIILQLVITSGYLNKNKRKKAEIFDLLRKFYHVDLFIGGEAIKQMEKCNYVGIIFTSVDTQNKKTW